MAEHRSQALALPALDFNGDGQITVSDTVEWAWYVLTLPGDAVISLLIRHAAPVAGFFEIGPRDLGGALSICLSVLFWLCAIIALSSTLNAIRDFDRWLTSWFTGHLQECLRLSRIARRRLVSWIGRLRERRQQASQRVAVDLDNFDSAVLRCYASVGDMRVLAAAEVADALKTSVNHVQSALRRLGEYRLVEPAFGTDEGRDAHQITQAGQIYLLER